MQKETFRTLLALTQQEIAALLNVSRGHYAMYESGKRDLPLEAKLKLSEMISQTQVSNPAKRETRSVASQRKHKSIQQLKLMIRENEYQQISLEKKIASIERRQEKVIKRQRILDVFHASETSREQIQHPAVALIKASKDAAIDLSFELLKLEIKREVLAFERSLLDAKSLEIM
ncbi:MAG: XRE family transcriptional regulator [Flavobacterium sp.]|nr:MAG: XRE family transcriptional regulator [Flavobacterium sp.]